MFIYIRIQMYQLWLPTAHDFLFIINNDVLVPDGVLTALMRAMEKSGARAAPVP